MCKLLPFEGANSIETDLQTSNLWTSQCSAKVIIITWTRLQQATGESDTVNGSGFYTFAGPWVISVSRQLGKKD